jgi:ribosome-binding protein aMBF1 (putative translation factor)
MPYVDEPLFCTCESCGWSHLATHIARFTDGAEFLVCRSCADEVTTRGFGTAERHPYLRDIG